MKTSANITGVFDLDTGRLIGLAPKGTSDVTYVAGQDTATPAGALPVTATTDPVTGVVRNLAVANSLSLVAYDKLNRIGKTPVTVSGIGNSIMVSGMNWVMHACQQSKGLLVPYDRCHGVAGNTTAQMLARVNDVPVAADLVFIQECSNDAAGGVTAAAHNANMEAMIQFYMNRGQLPVICFPPARSDNATYNVATFKLGMCDFFTAKKYGIPIVFPWRSFTNADATGGLATAAGSSDGLHPGNGAHPTAGTATLNQLLGLDHCIPLPQSSNKYGNIGLLADALHLVGNGGFSTNSGTGADLSSVTDSSAVGNWIRATSNGGGDYQFQKSGTYYGNVGDELYICYLARSGGTWASGFAQVNPMQVPSFGNSFGGYAYVPAPIAAGVIAGESALGGQHTVVTGTTSVMVLAEINAPTGNTIDVAQMQIWNKSAILR